MSVPVALVDQVCNLVKQLNLLRTAQVQKSVEIFSNFVLGVLFVEGKQYCSRNAKPLSKTHYYVQARLLLIPLNGSPEIG